MRVRWSHVLMQGGLLGGAQAALAVLAPPVFGLPPLLVGWAGLLWGSSAWDRRDVHLPSLLAVGLAATLPLVGAAVWAGLGVLPLLAGSVSGLLLSLVELLPSLPEATDPEEWARANRDRYRGRGTGRRIDTVSHDPYRGLFGTSNPVPAPKPDPYDDGDVRYHEHVDDDGRPR
ncbi:MAG: hypothetical protein KTR31_40610 [Myxococcales bacterium]|nr:hypothetical protein [Myxococcales bacterium]